MKANDLFLKNSFIYRLLATSDDRVLIINCLDKKMPYWTNLDFLDSTELITQEELLKLTNTEFPDLNSIPQDKIKSIHEKYGTISLILAHISKDEERNSTIDICSQIK